MIIEPIQHTPLIQGALLIQKIQTKVETEDISAISAIPGCPWVSTNQDEPIEFDFLCLECNYQRLKKLNPKSSKEE